MTPGYLIWLVEHDQRFMPQAEDRRCFPSAGRARAEDERAAALSLPYRRWRDAAGALGRLARSAFAVPGRALRPQASSAGCTERVTCP